MGLVVEWFWSEQKRCSSQSFEAGRDLMNGKRGGGIVPSSSKPERREEAS